MYEGFLYCILPYFNGSETVTCVKLFSHETERGFNTNQVRELIRDHNESNTNNDDNDL